MAKKIGEYAEWKVKYPCTNESILAVIAGLDLKKNNVVVSVAGSGDIPFAIAPYVRRVYAVDNNLGQINFMKEQMDFLRAGKFVSFFRSDFLDKYYELKPGIRQRHLDEREKYFKKNFSRIQDSLSKIEVINLDFIKFIKDFSGDLFDRIYISNIRGWSSNSWNRHRRQNLGSFVGNVSVGGLIYETFNHRDSGKFSRSRRIEVNEERTLSARSFQSKVRFGDYDWTPVVYEKIK